mmetsp:Transcript_31021/g.40974  ORF Transcript_31021/g.40974 Transcript_31021/m.40974 type:complete len:260 (+) Transcript_31021:305-1084(+)
MIPRRCWVFFIFSHVINIKSFHGKRGLISIFIIKVFSAHVLFIRLDGAHHLNVSASIIRYHHHFRKVRHVAGPTRDTENVTAILGAPLIVLVDATSEDLAHHLIGGLSNGDQVDVVPPQTAHRPKRQEGEHREDCCHWTLQQTPQHTEGVGLGGVTNGSSRVDHDQESGEHDGGEEAEEVLIVALTHAAPHPGAVVVEPLHAQIARAAMLGSGRAVDVAGFTVLVTIDPYHSAGRELRLSPHGLGWKDAGLHQGCHPQE